MIRYLSGPIDRPSILKKIIIAIDGASSCGKSTLAKTLAQQLGYVFVDSGAMYRAFTLYLLRNNIALEEDAITEALSNIHISFKNIDGKNTAFLNGKNVETDIRTMNISDNVSEVAVLSIVRKFVVAQQKAMSTQKGVVMDGRDTGTVVFPNAELKLFISAAIETRTDRRYKELLDRGFKITRQEVHDNLQKRDHIDSTRQDSPLIRAKDAIGLDTTHLTPTAALEIALRLAKNAIHEEH